MEGDVFNGMPSSCLSYKHVETLVSYQNPFNRGKFILFVCLCLYQCPYVDSNAKLACVVEFVLPFID